jgi:hypothetical protein
MDLYDGSTRVANLLKIVVRKPSRPRVESGDRPGDICAHRQFASSIAA